MTDINKQYVVDFAEMDGDTPDWAEVKKVADGVYMRAAHGNRPDPTYGKHAQAARDAGLLVGAYGIIEWFPGAAPIEAQAKALLAQLAEYSKPGDLPPSMDVEFGNGRPAGLSAGDALARAETYGKIVVAERGIVLVYSSAGQWADNLGDLRSAFFAGQPGWPKTGYFVREHNPMHPESQGPLGHLQMPMPWRAPSSFGCWLQQFQGDVWGFGGLRQCDVSAHVPALEGEHSERVRCMQTVLKADGGADGIYGQKTADAVRELQRKVGLPDTGEVDLATWVALCDAAAHSTLCATATAEADQKIS